MANKSRQSANLVSDTNLYVDVTNNMVGIGTTIPTSKLNVVGDVLVSGVVTATSFVGSVTGTATTATNLSDAANITAGTISSSRLSGSYGINITGTATTATTAGYANTAGISTVSQGLTGTPNITVGVVTATSFVKSSGTSSQFLKADGSVDSNTYLTSESDTFYTVTNRGNTSAAGINVSGDLYVSGNISFGGTTTQLNLKQLEIVDADIVLGIGTSFSPTDTTANHGGIAIASTEGTPLVSLKIAPGETNPDTYKKIMWFKSNEAGLGTDAWLANYAVGIGSTQFPNGTRLAAGNVQFTQNDLTVIRNISASGIITATSGFTGNLTGTATTATTAGYANTSGISTVSQGLTGTPNIVVGIATATTLNVGTVGIKTITTVTDITAADYQGKSKSVTTDDGTPQAVYVGAAGTAMFIVGSTNDRVIQYTLSTPYDVSTAGAAVTFFSNTAQETSGTGIDFNTTGTKMFLSGNTAVAPLIVGGDYIHEYSLSTAWNVAPSSVGWTTSFRVLEDTDPQAVAFGSSGSKMYVVGNTNNVIYQYSLSTPYSLASGVTYDSKSLAVGTLVGETSPTDISFNSTGTVLWVLGSANDRIYEFRLGTAWDISTAVFYDDVFVAFNEGGPTGLQVLPNQNVLYVVGTVNDTVYQYALNSPALQISASGINTASSIILNNETRIKDKLYVKGNTIIDGTLIAQGSSAVEGNLTVSGGSITAGNVAATLLGGNTTTNITLANAQTTGTLTVGGSAQTGAITLGLSTVSQTTNIQSGINTSGTQKTINIGTGGASGSNTLITLGSATAGAISTVTIPSPTNLKISGGLYDGNNNVGTAGSVLTSTGAGVSWSSISATPNLTLINTQTFNTVGIDTWTKPSGAYIVRVIAIGAGGGGSGGTASLATGANGGGGGGGGGARIDVRIFASELNATEPVVVGAGGIGGTSVSQSNTGGNTSVAGGTGGAGGNSSFATLYIAAGGSGGAGSASNAAVGPGGNGGNDVSSTPNGGYFPTYNQSNDGGSGAASDNNPASIPVVNTVVQVSAGGAQGPYGSAGTANQVGFAGGSAGTGTGSTVTGGAAGLAGNNPGGNGSTSADGFYASGGGSGGGSYAASGVVVGGRGGNGGFPGGGGGAGGSARNGTNNNAASSATSGIGGTGGNGLVVVYTYG